MTGWSDEQVETVRQLWKRGLTAREIAAELGGTRSRNAICGLIDRKGFAGGTPPRGGRPPKPKAPKNQVRVCPQKVAEARAARKKPTAKARPAPAMPPPVISPPRPRADRPGLMALKSKDCRWPYGDPRDEDFHFCGHPIMGDTVEETPYCEAHARLAYQPTKPIIGQPRPVRRAASENGA